MSILNTLFIAFSLSLDCVAVSMASAMTMKKLHMPLIARTAFIFGFFQMLMPVIGWLAGTALHRMVSKIDHWMAFSLLAVIGSKMIFEAFALEKKEKKSDLSSSYLLLLTMAIATSIDALAVGVTFSFIGIDIITPVLIIGIVSFILTFAGGLVGYRFGLIFEKKIEIIGGIILIAIGTKILLEHLGIV